MHEPHSKSKAGTPAPRRSAGGSSRSRRAANCCLRWARRADPCHLRELAKAADMAPGKAHPYLVSFAKLGLVTQEASTGYYWLGPTAMQLGLVTLEDAQPGARGHAVRGEHCTGNRPQRGPVRLGQSGSNYRVSFRRDLSASHQHPNRDRDVARRHRDGPTCSRRICPPN